MIAAGLLAVIAIAACSTTPREPVSGVRPDSQGEASRLPAPEAKADRGRPGHTEADVRFMQHMMAHHAQALAMTSLVPAHSDNAAIRLLAERIEASQRTEIAQMRRWLERRGEDVPSLDAHQAPHAAGGHEALMSGMLTGEELARLAEATGTAFDRLFLEFMIRHHEGALVMVADLLGSPGAAQEPETFQLASDVDADQRAEIARMRALLESLSTGAFRR